MSSKSAWIVRTSGDDGTASDKRDMADMGKKQVLRRNFNFTTILGFSCNVMVAWEFLFIISFFALEDGGTPVIFWGMIVATIGMGMVYCSLAEMASMFPTAGGQYHWVYALAPVQYRKVLSYSVGWLLVIGWQDYLSGTCFVVGGMTNGLIILNVKDYEPHPYQVTLLAIAIAAMAIGFNTLLPRKLPLVGGMIAFLHIAGLFGIIIPLLIMAPKTTAYDALLKFTNEGGWPTTGIAAMIGLTSMIGVLIGYDCSTHLAEEVCDASTAVPNSLVWSTGLNAILCIIGAVAYVFCLGNVDKALASPTGYPFIEVFYNATQSTVGTSLMVGIMLVMYIAAVTSQITTASRQLWSFARDRAFPFSEFLSQVDGKIPRRAIFLSFVITCLLVLINLGSSAALNAFNSLGATAICFSYFLSIACVVYRRLFGDLLPPRRWSLGKYGLAVNVAALVFVIPIMFFFAWPLTRPVTAQNMNWSCVMFFGVLLIAFIHYWAKARHVYHGPRREIDELNPDQDKQCE